MTPLDALATAVFWLGIALLVYTEVGYLALLWMVSRFRRLIPPADGAEPTVTLLIAAHNEEGVIGRKLENTLALVYPREKLQVIVASDGSTDRTDDIVRQYERQGVVLHRAPERAGKVPTLRSAERIAGGDVLLFSDADSSYDADAVHKLVRHFADPKVGAVSGHEVRVASQGTGKGKGEGLYSRLDNAIKEAEGRVGSQVMVNGGFFAIRRELSPFIPDHLTHDGIVPLQLYLNGYRTAYEPQAASVEVYALDSGADFSRRIRTVLQAIQSYLYVKQALNPFRTGFYAIQIWSHRFLRWVMLPVLATVLVASLWLAPREPFYLACAAAQGLCYVLAFCGWALDRRGKRPAVFYFPFYFTYIHAAAFAAVIQALTGRRITTWHPTQRETKAEGTIRG